MLVLLGSRCQAAPFADHPGPSATGRNALPPQAVSREVRCLRSFLVRLRNAPARAAMDAEPRTKRSKSNEHQSQDRQ